MHVKGDLCIKLLSLFIAINVNAVADSVNDYDDHYLPVHYAAACNTAEVLDFLLSEYAESALKLSSSFDYNLLHLVLQDDKNEVDMVAAKVKLLTTKYPILLRMHSSCGLTPFHQYLVDDEKIFGDRLKMKIVSDLIAVDKDVVTQGALEPHSAAQYGMNEEELLQFNNHLSLPLHMIVKSKGLTQFLPVSEMADIFRLLLNLHPGAIGIIDIHGKYPYDYAVESKLDPYFTRMLLRGDPTIDPTLLYDLNYAERRLALFVAFRAVTRNVKVSIWANLRFENKDLLKKVISFL